MTPEGFEPLSFEDHVLIARVNLCWAAVAVLVFAFAVDSWDWPVRGLAALGAAGLILLARQLEAIFRRLDPGGEQDRARPPVEYYLHPF